MTPLTIQDRTISQTSPTLVIAEIGVNHDGSVSRALELVEHAHRAGADAVKLQIFRARTLMHASSAFAGYQAERCAEASPAEMLRRYEMEPEAVERVVAAIRERGMLPIATPFSLEDVELVGRLGLPAVKIASPDLVNRPLLRRVAELGRPMLVSTGASTLEEIRTAVGWMGEWRAAFALLHCISSYPTPVEEANLCWIGDLAAAFGVPVGHSDHTTELLAGPLAVAAGATIIEKHLTYDRAAQGPDHEASFDPGQFAQYVRLIRQAERMRGTPGRRVLAIEQDVRRVSRQSLVARRALLPGERVREEDLTVQRPGTGIPAAEVGRVVGMRTTAAVAAGAMLSWDVLVAA
jgi:N-acetylneuraminate synthase/N,N'-diacetyllegionaminate synthase